MGTAQSPAQEPRGAPGEGLHDEGLSVLEVPQPQPQLPPPPPQQQQRPQERGIELSLEHGGLGPLDEASSGKEHGSQPFAGEQHALLGGSQPSLS